MRPSSVTAALGICYKAEDGSRSRTIIPPPQRESHTVLGNRPSTAKQRGNVFQHQLEGRCWDFVDRILPDYQDRKEWLRVNGAGMDL